MTPPRVALLDAGRALAVAEEAGVPGPLATLNVFRVLLHRPKVAKAMSDLLLSMLFGGALDDRLREFVIMRIGWATGADYEWTQHWTIARDTFGCSESDLLELRDWEASDHFDDTERAVLALVDETLATGSASAAAVARCRELLGSDESVVELVAAIGAWRSISQLTRSLEIPLEEGVDSWPPDGRPGGAS
jgi:alkylhydroperoxidase family enzyme